MSRHRNVRSMNYSDEYDGYDDVYGHSVEDDYTISPSDAAFMYDRNHQPQMSAFLAEEDDIAEEDESELDNKDQGTERRDSETYQRPQLSDIDEARLLSCIEEIRNVIGDTISEQALVDTILKHDFNLNKSLDAILSCAASSAQSEDSSSKRQQEKKDTGKDQDDNQTPFYSNKDLHSLRTDIFNLAIQPPSTVPKTFQGFLESKSVDSRLSIEFAKRLNTGSNREISIPKFKLKTNPKLLKEDSSDDEEGTLSALIAKHQTKAPAAIKKFTSLTDLVNQHLQTKPLVLRQPFGSILSSSETSLNGTNIFPPLKPGLFYKNFDENDFKIDLSCALKPSSSRTMITNIAVKEPMKFKPGFLVDSVLKSSLNNMASLACVINTASILYAKVPRQKELSSFGKVVCRRWRNRVIPMLCRPSSREVLHEIVLFDFHTPSPDDVIKLHLRRK